MSGTVLVLGASGRFGRHTAAAFWNAGWRVQLFNRGQDDLMALARDADVIVNGWNPPYPDWQAELPALTDQVIRAASQNDATVILPGNVYVYGDQAPRVLTPDTPHRARNPLGRVRIEMEQRYRASGTRTILLRAGDFIDDTASGNWFDKIITARVAAGRISYPGSLDRPHSWAWLPDMARAAVMLAEQRHRLERFEDLTFPGFTLSGSALAAALSRVLQRPVRASRMNWLPLRLAAPVWKMGRHLLEMCYLWDMPHRLDGDRLARLLPAFRATPLNEALAQAIAPQCDPDHVMPHRPIGPEATA